MFLCQKASVPAYVLGCKAECDSIIVIVVLRSGSLLYHKHKASLGYRVTICLTISINQSIKDNNNNLIKNT